MTSYEPSTKMPPHTSTFNSDKASDNQLEAALAEQTNAGEISELTVVAEGEESVTWFIWMLIACSSVSGLLFGACGRASFHPYSTKHACLM